MRLQRLAHQSLRVAGLPSHRQAPRAGVGHVQQISDQLPHPAAGAQDGVHRPAAAHAAAGIGLACQQLGRQADRAQGAAQVVGDDGEQIVARAHRLLELPQEPLALDFGVLALGVVRDHADEAPRASRAIEQHLPAFTHPALGAAVGGQDAVLGPVRASAGRLRSRRKELQRVLAVVGVDERGPLLGGDRHVLRNAENLADLARPADQASRQVPVVGAEIGHFQGQPQALLALLDRSPNGHCEVTRRRHPSGATPG